MEAPDVEIDLLPAFEGLNDRERILVEARLKGMTIAGAAAGMGITPSAATALLSQAHVKAAIRKGREICAQAFNITRERLTQMLLEAYRSADTATEMVLAVRELAKLHGLNAPTQVNIDHSHRLAAVKTEADIKQLSIQDLERIASMRGSEVIEGEFQALPAPARVRKHG